MSTLIFIGIIILQGIYSTHRGHVYAELKAKNDLTEAKLIDTAAKLSDTQSDLQELAKIQHPARILSASTPTT